MTEGIRELRRRRPRSRFVRWSALGLALLVALSWADVIASSASFLTARRLANLNRFLGEIRPHPLQGRDFDLGVATRWIGDFIGRRGGEAMATTLAISVAAVVLAGALGLAASFLGARNLASPEPFAFAPRPPGALRRALWTGITSVTRSVFVLSRAMPEYLMAFLLLAVLGPTAWAAVLALAIHNSGILGRLNAETVENLPPRVPRALRALGAGRLQIAATALLPASMPRFLLYFFYRWETCVREATVLGMLGIVSLGYWIEDARARHHYDQMMLLVVLGAVLVVVGDAVSAVARRIVRRAG
jgi:phosphonate transport system permease protein